MRLPKLTALPAPSYPLAAGSCRPRNGRIGDALPDFLQPDGPRYATVVPLRAGDLRLTYRIPPALAEVGPGSLVIVPLQRRRENALVLAVSGTTGVPEDRIRNLSGHLADGRPALPGDLLELAQWIARYYLAPLPTVLEAMIPAPVRSGTGPRRESVLEAVRPVGEETLFTLRRRAAKQARLLEVLLEQNGPVPRTPLLRQLGLSTAVADGLVEKGLARMAHRTLHRAAYSDELADEAAEEGEPPPLTAEQAEAVRILEEARAGGGYAAWLLHGVTGSGKTEVYLRLIERTLAEGRQVLFLVPEIALAPQTVARVRARLLAAGTRVVVWHSNLSAGERADAFRATVSGEAAVVVGARSAVFAPFRDLGLVIVDEEHEPAYKQEEAPRYHGRDVALLRASRREVLCVLGSATPSLESLANVRRGKIQLVRLTKRVDDRQLPLFHIVDLRRASRTGKAGGIFTPLLREKLAERVERGEQSILFLNRRGFATTALCPDCGATQECPHCSLTLTLHQTDRIMRCHLCGYERPAPAKCPECGSRNFQWKGTGTQKVEAAARQLLPSARIVRVDADASRRRHELRGILREFRRGRIDVLVGTQMIAKGLDFPNVTLVGLVDADLSLHQEDFRAAERTFQLLVQVAGRAGRGERAGEVVVQTLTPSASPIQYARQRDFEAFLEEELEQRREFRYPPERHLIRQLFTGRNEEKVWFVADQWARAAEEHLPASVEIRGPAPAPIEKWADEYRVQLWYFSSAVLQTTGRLTAIDARMEVPEDVRIAFDVDAVSLR